ncbi:hypothetical protein [Carboxylicivirga marina]|uniref:hypothetical protein n=1 Tax=Carboxylicivirga marina TaxID=2800988 RepID=UPI00259795D1|nr:hypothetical protein [uncultured Carboxylicivirga sp.]
MKAKEFNDLTERYVKEKLASFEFKKSGVHFYMHESPNIMVLHKKTHKSFFEGFCLAFTHDFLKNTKDSKGKTKIPPYLEDFPISIPLDMLEKQYTKYKTSKDFDYDMNFLTRKVEPTRKYSKSNPGRFIDFEELLKNDYKAEKYISDSIDLVNDFGMKFFKEFSVQTTYRALTKFSNLDVWQLNRFLEETKEYMIGNNIAIPKQKQSFIKRLFK